MPNLRFLKNILAYFSPFLTNRNVWEQTNVVEQYGTRDDLYYPEQIILKLLKEKAPKMKMLDLGVGAGRTTSHFGPLMKEYVGVDSSSGMIKFCKQKFRDTHFTFKVADSKNLKEFSDEEFDFVLFSFNGLDCISHEARQKALTEIYRVLKYNGIFCFSSHNLNWVWKYWTIRKGTLFSLNNVRKLLLLRVYNRKSWKTLRQRNKTTGHMVVVDGAHNFGVRNYHITPTAQVKQLIENSFREIKMYNLVGKVPDFSNIETDADAWLYYMCSK